MPYTLLPGAVVGSKMYYYCSIKGDASMQAVYLRRSVQKANRPAFALLMLLIVVAIGMLIYYFALYPVDRKAAREQKQSPDKYPWVEEWRIKGSRMRKPRNAAEQAPSEEQPKITEILLFKADAKQQRDDRGQISLTIAPDGIAEGYWTGEYDTGSPHMNCVVVSANFKGNTDPSKVYSDQEGRDRSKLYFITKGKYLILETNFENSQVRNVGGHIYVTGWISDDYSITGKITITPDKKTLQSFNWQASPLN